MSSSTVEQLQNTSTALRDALAQQDWQAVGISQRLSSRAAAYCG